MSKEYIDSLIEKNKNNINRYLIDNISSDTSVIEVGCGNGVLMYDFLSNFKGTYLGIDINKSKIEKAKILYKENKNLKFITLDIENINKKLYSKFDVLLIHSCIPILDNYFYRAFTDGKRKFSPIIANNFIILISDFLSKGKIVIYSHDLGESSTIPIADTDLKYVVENYESIFKNRTMGLLRFNSYYDSDVIVITKTVRPVFILIKIIRNLLKFKKSRL